MRRSRSLPGAPLSALVLLLAACATSPPADNTPASAAAPAAAANAQAAAASEGVPAKPVESAADRSRLYPGTGVLVKGQGALPPQRVPSPPSAGGSNVMLNFEGADLREVVRNVLGDILNESYTIDPSVGGQVTIRTSTGIPRDALPATLEMLLRMNGATMVREGGVYKILPQATALRGNVTPQLGNTQRPLPQGFSVQIVPLRFIGVREMMRILEPIAKDPQAVRADDLRNMIILTGTERELRHLMETIDMFDVDWIAGMSVGFFTLQSVDVRTVMQELQRAFGDPNTSPLTGILRIIPIERLNALIVITPQPAYLQEAKAWIERLDKSGGEAGGVRFYVYNLQFQRAEKIGPLLQQAFTGRATQAAGAAPPTVAPGTPAGSIVSPPTFQPQTGGVPGGPPGPQTTTTTTTSTQTAPVAAAVAALAQQRAGEGIGVVRNLQVVADKDNNTLLIVATPAEYSIIEQALKKLDVAQRQVLMEVTLAEVHLTDALSIGVEALFHGAAPGGRGSGGLFTNSVPFNPQAATPAANAGLSLPAAAPVFSYIINSAKFPGGIQAILNTLDTYGNTKVLANPQLAALDNQKATIKVGTRIPICQETTVGNVANAVTTTSSYIDTGVLLQVTPHIGATGSVTLDVQAEVSIPGTTTRVCEAPPINTRSVQTLLTVPSMQTMVMGGLITDTRQNSSNGLPILSRIPVIGGLFGSQSLNVDRVELVMFITPRVIEGESGIAEVIDELRRRMDRLDFVFPAAAVPAAEQTGAERLKRGFEELFPALSPIPRAGPVPKAPN
jgi:general secretion pathway protein D